MAAPTPADALLGALLVSGPRAAAVLANELEPGDFPDPVTAGLFGVISGLVRAGRPCDALAVFDELVRQGPPTDAAQRLEDALRPREPLRRAITAVSSAVAELPSMTAEPTVRSAQALLRAVAYEPPLTTGVDWLDEALRGGLTKGEVVIVARVRPPLNDRLLEAVVGTLATRDLEPLVITQRPRDEVLRGVASSIAGAADGSPRHRVARAFVGARELAVLPPDSDWLSRTADVDVVLLENALRGTRGDALRSIARQGPAVLALEWTQDRAAPELRRAAYDLACVLVVAWHGLDEDDVFSTQRWERPGE